MVNSTKQIKTIETVTRNLARIALEAKAVSWAFQSELAAAVRSELVATAGLVEAIRLVKDAGRSPRIERACGIADVAFAQTKQRLTEGVTEAEFAAELEFEMRRRGAARASFETIVASGPNGALPHAQPTDRVISPGDLVVVDFGAVFDGYHSDMTRTVCVGEPSAADAALLAAVAASDAPVSSPSRPARPGGRSTRPAASRSGRPVSPRRSPTRPATASVSRSTRPRCSPRRPRTCCRKAPSSPSSPGRTSWNTAGPASRTPWS